MDGAYIQILADVTGIGVIAGPRILARLDQGTGQHD